MLNYYQILGLPNQASASEVKKAFRDMVKIYHPDINPSVEASEKIILIMEAYEVLSEESSKYFYDQQFLTGFTSTHKETPPEVTEQERVRKAYRRKRQEEENARIAHLFKIKKNFYAFQRASCFFFLLLGFLFTVDYFYQSDYETITIRNVGLEKKNSNNYLSIIRINNGEKMRAVRGVYDHFIQGENNVARLYKSSVFGTEAQIGIKYKSQYLRYMVLGKVQEFGNVFSYLIILFCLVIIKQKEYKDWALTLAFLPFFLTLFVWLLVS